MLVLLALIEAAALFVWQGNGYWEFSDGVYAETARALLRGSGLYSGVAAAQPPPVYLAGAVLLAIHDGAASLRIGLGLVMLLNSGLVAASVWRLTGRPLAAAAGALAAPLVPISLHEHAQLIPETLAAPLILGGAWLCADDERAGAGGVLLACAVACKLAFALPAALIIAAGAGRGRALRAFVLAALVGAAATIAAFGTDVLREVIVAQTQVGTAPLHDVAGVTAQAAWNEWPLVLLAGWAVVGARDLADHGLRRTLCAAAVGGLALALTLLKSGSAIDVLVVADPPLVALAAVGATSGFERRRARPVLAGLTAVLIGVMVLQSGSLLLDPGAPVLARRPFATSGLEYRMSPQAVTRAVHRAQACAPGVAYSGDPYLAFLAGRRMPGGQPDLFIISHASAADARFARRALADRPVCP